MNLYNMINRTSPLTFLVLPVLGKHPEEYPRFRDCFMEDEESPDTKGKIHIYTRVGGGNRESYENEINELKNSKHFITDYDEGFDCTYATFVFDIPKEFIKDIEKVLNGKLKETSEEYKKTILNTFPKIESKLKEELY